MKTFTDAKGREWSIELNISVARRVKAATGVDFLAVWNGQLACLQQLEDPEKLCDGLFCICEAQAKAAGVTAEQFGEGLAGDVVARATTALLEELVGFTPNPRLRTALQRVLDAGSTAVDRRMTLLEERLDKALPAAIVLAATGQPSGDLPGSSA
jgi:hypothetical protein